MVDPFDALLELNPIVALHGAAAPLPAAIERYVISEVEQERARLRELRTKGLGAENTLRAYRADWRSFTAWCDANDVASLPATPSDVARYVRYLFDRPVATFEETYQRGNRSVTRTVRVGPAKAKTISRHLLTIKKAHRLLGYEDPTAHRDSRLTVAGLKRERGNRTVKKAALLHEVLARATDALDLWTQDERTLLLARLTDGAPRLRTERAITALDLRFRRDKAILLLGWSGALRRSEIVGLDRDDVRFVDEGAELRLFRSKMNQGGDYEIIAIPVARGSAPCPVRALQSWLISITEHGPLFRNIDRHGRIGDRLGAPYVAKLVKVSAAALGLDSSTFGAHSLRSGWITTAAKAHVPEERGMRHSRHKSIGVYRDYVNRASVWEDHPTLQMFPAEED